MIRTLILAKQANRELTRLIHPAIVNRVKVGGGTIPNNVVIAVLGFIFLFFAYSPAWSIVLGIAMVLLIYLFEILIDNSFARMKWQFTLKSSWLVAASFGFVKLLVLYFVRLF